MTDKLIAPGFSSSPEMFINRKDVPPYNPRKHFWEQSRDVLQFWEEEYDKLINGVNINGYKMHPLLYYGINHFKASIPVKRASGRFEEDIMTPPLTDNFLFFAETYEECEQTDMGMYIFGARGVNKTTLLSCVTTYLLTTKPNGTTNITGGSDPDLQELAKAIKVGMLNMTPAFKVPTLINEWDSQVELGTKLRDGSNRFTHSYVKITNADAGKQKKSEKGAGGNPVGYILDEGGKWDPRALLRSALPSFVTPYGAKLVHILAGTSGNMELAAPTQSMMENLEEYRLTPMNWERLERNVPEEYQTWKHSKKDSFSVFIPGQMSMRLDVLKDDTNLGDFLKIKNPELKKIKMKATNWEKATKRLFEKLESIKDADGKDKERMYFPKDLDDIWLRSGHNPFPVAAIQRRIRELKDNPTYQKVELDVGEKVSFTFSSKSIADLEYKGSPVDAPIKFYGPVPEFPPTKHENAAGMDYYKLDQADDGSLGALYVLRRRNLEPNSPCEKIIASYVARPERQGAFDRIALGLLRATNAECNLEAVDTGFQKFLENLKLDTKYLCSAFSYAKTKDGKEKSLNTRYGLYPTAGNNQVRLKATVEWTKEEHTIGVDEDGLPIVKTSIDFVDDIELLEEMANWRKGGNFDRIAAFSHALVLAQRWDEKNIYPKKNTVEDYRTEETKMVVKREKRYFSSRRRNPYGNRR